MKGKEVLKTWVVAADMGYGHVRAALPLVPIAFQGKLIYANKYLGIPVSDEKIWHESRQFYEIVSKFRRFPVLGDFVFSIFDKFQEIKEFYPREQPIDSPSFQLKQIYGLLASKHWGEHLIEKLNKKPLPFVTTFFIPAFMAEHFHYKGPIYLIVTDTDISRAWAPILPSKTRIQYFVPTQRCVDRLSRYGVPKDNIVLTGFPLPQEFTRKNEFQSKQDLRRRIAVLDTRGKYQRRYSSSIVRYLGSVPRTKFRFPVHITFAIGGAGAQGELAKQVVGSLVPLLRAKKVTVSVISGIHKRLTADFEKIAKDQGMFPLLGKNLHIVSARTKEEYFRKFVKTLRATDILWTKPSELVFYAGLGLPILMAPPIGSQEKMNRKWLLQIGAGIDQLDPTVTHEWLPDLIEDGVFAEAAMQGFIEIEKNGTEHIMKYIAKDAES